MSVGHLLLAHATGFVLPAAVTTGRIRRAIRGKVRIALGRTTELVSGLRLMRLAGAYAAVLLSWAVG